MTPQDQIVERAVLVQFILDGSKPNYAKLKDRLNAPTINAAQVRWTRLRKKIMQEEGILAGGESSEASAKKSRGKKTAKKENKEEEGIPADGEASEASTLKSATRKTAEKKPASKKRKAAQSDNEIEA